LSPSSEPLQRDTASSGEAGHSHTLSPLVVAVLVVVVMSLRVVLLAALMAAVALLSFAAPSDAVSARLLALRADPAPAAGGEVPSPAANPKPAADDKAAPDTPVSSEESSEEQKVVKGAAAHTMPLHSLNGGCAGSTTIVKNKNILRHNTARFKQC
jgi:hypothetical protein